MITLTKIEKEKLLIVEGKDEHGFFEELLRHLHIEDVQIIGIGGKEKFLSDIPLIVKLPGFDKVTKLAIIRDADSNATSAFQSLSGILNRLNLVPPSTMNAFSNGTPACGIYIMPGNSSTGMLEDLCLSLIEDSSIISCTDSFIECIRNHGNNPSNISKTRMLVYLSTCLRTPNSILLASKQHLWNMSSPNLAGITQFLLNYR